MVESLVIIGGGGMGRCALDVIDAVNAASESQLEVVGVIDDGRPDLDLLTGRGVNFLGTLSALEELDGDIGYLIAIADPAVRQRIDRRLILTGRPSPVLVHPNVHLGHGVTLAPGSIICSHVSVENNIRIGRHVHVNQNCTIGHDSVLSDHVTVSPLVAVSGNVSLSSGSFLGTGSSIRQGITVGSFATVAMGAAVIRDVPDGVTVSGVPASPLRGVPKA